MPPFRIALWVFSFGGIALCARALLTEPPPLWIAVSALLFYATLATLGVLIPQLEMYGDITWRGSEAAPVVALTFDDGPHPVSTRQVLDILAKRGHVATFFVVGRKVEQYPDVVREIVEAGHHLGLHGHAHDRLYSLKTPRYVEDDIKRTREVIERVAGVSPRLLRPPIGYVSHRTAAGAKKAGVALVAWSVRGLDGRGSRDVDRVVRRIQRGLRPGAIVLLHDAAEREDFEPVAPRALPEILDAIERAGLRTVTVDRFVGEEAPAEARPA